MEERRERVLTPSAGIAAYRGRRHAGSRWRGTVAQCHGDSGKREQRAWLPLLSARPAVTPATLKIAATNLVNRGTMGVNSLPKTVTRQLRGFDLNPDPPVNESSTQTTRLPSPLGYKCAQSSNVPVKFLLFAE